MVMALVVYLLSLIIVHIPTIWQVRVLLLVILMILVVGGFFAGPYLLPHGRQPALR